MRRENLLLHSKVVSFLFGTIYVVKYINKRNRNEGNTNESS